MNRTSVLVALLLASGTAFAQAPPFVEKPFPLIWQDSWGVAIGDFDKDGFPDVAALNSQGPDIFECSGPPGTIQCGNRMALCLSLGQGFGRFGAPSCVPALCLPWTIATGDFDQDGRLDAVVGNRGARDAFGICFPPSLSYFPGNGAGGFAFPVNKQIVDEPLGLGAGDLDGDGRPEIVLALGGSGRIEIWGVTAARALIQKDTLFLGTEAGPMALGDLDGDGHLDAAVSLPLIDRVAVLRGNGLGGLAEVERCPTGGDNPQGVAIADFAPGGDAEIAVANAGVAFASSSWVGVLRRDAGSYCGPNSLFVEQVPGSVQQVAAADLDLDGDVDLGATVDFFKVLVLENDGLGHPLYLGSVPTTSRSHPLAAGDLDRIGAPDLLTSGDPISGSAGPVSVLVNTSPVADTLMLDVAGDRVSWIGVRDAVSYDLVGGNARILQATHGDFTASLDACIANDYADIFDQFPGEQFPMPNAPPPGGIWWILGRPNFPLGPGSYDGEPGQVGSRDAEIAASGLACP